MELYIVHFNSDVLDILSFFPSIDSSIDIPIDLKFPSNIINELLTIINSISYSHIVFHETLNLIHFLNMYTVYQRIVFTTDLCTYINSQDHLRKLKLYELPLKIGNLDIVDFTINELNYTGKLLTSISTYISQLHLLQTLDLSSNQLTQLPASIGKLSSLQTLNLSLNSLTHLPDSIGQLSSLQELYCFSNQLPAYIMEDPIKYISSLLIL